MGFLKVCVFGIDVEHTFENGDIWEMFNERKKLCNELKSTRGVEGNAPLVQRLITGLVRNESMVMRIADV